MSEIYAKLHISKITYTYIFQKEEQIIHVNVEKQKFKN